MVRRPTEMHSATDFVPCHICYGFFLKTALSRHVHICDSETASTTTSTDAVKQGRLLLAPLMITDEHTVKLGSILAGMKDTNANEGKYYTICQANVRMPSKCSVIM